MDTTVEGLRERLSAAITAAMKRRDRPATAALRAASARLSNAKAVPVDTLPRAGAVEAAAFGAGAADVARHELTAARVAAIVREEADELRTAADQMSAAGQDERAEELLVQARVLDEFLAG